MLSFILFHKKGLLLLLPLNTIKIQSTYWCANIN